VPASEMVKIPIYNYPETLKKWTLIFQKYQVKDTLKLPKR
jgi:hypothetical protein